MKYIKTVFTTVCCAIVYHSEAKGIYTSENSDKESIYVNNADSSRIYDLDEIIVVSQPKESTLLRYQPMASSMFSSTAFMISANCQIMFLASRCHHMVHD